jgi:hypothetical protein
VRILEVFGGSCSPRTRGWSPWVSPLALGPDVLPRARGDGPRYRKRLRYPTYSMVPSRPPGRPGEPCAARARRNGFCRSVVWFPGWSAARARDPRPRLPPDVICRARESVFSEAAHGYSLIVLGPTSTTHLPNSRSRRTSCSCIGTGWTAVATAADLRPPRHRTIAYHIKLTQFRIRPRLQSEIDL